MTAGIEELRIEKANPQDAPNPIREAFVASIDRMIADGAIDRTIDKLVQKTVVDALDTAMRSYSSFAKQVEAAVVKALNVGSDQGIDLPAYGDLVLKIVRRQVDAAIGQQLQRQVANRLTTLLEPLPAKIKLSTFAEQFRKWVEEKHSDDCHCEPGKMTFMIDRSHGPSFTYLHFDEITRKTSYECAYMIATHHAKVFRLSINKADVEKRLFAGPFHAFERTLFQMHAQQTEIEFDVEESDIDKSYGGHD